MTSREKLFLALGLTRAKRKPGVTFSWEKGNSRKLDVQRFLHHRPHWQQNAYYHADSQRKKIIVNYYQCVMPPLPRMDERLWSYLFYFGFDVYIRTAPYRLAEIKSPAELYERLYVIELTDNETILNELSEQGASPDDYLILNHVERAKLIHGLLRQLQLHFSMSEQFNVDKEISEMALGENIHTLSEKQLDQLLKNVTRTAIKTIRYRSPVESDMERQVCDITWKNDVDSRMIKKVLQSMVRKTDFQTTLTSCDSLGLSVENLSAEKVVMRMNYPSLDVKLTHCSVDASGKEFDFIDVYPGLKIFEVERAILSDSFVAMMVNLPVLEDLTLRYCRGVSHFDAGLFSKMKRLSITNELDEDLSLLGIEKCQYLEELSLFMSPLAGGISKLTHLKKLSKLSLYYIALDENNLGECDHLTELLLYEVKNIKILDVSKLNNLKKITIKRSDVESIVGLGCCPNLEEITLGECSSLNELDLTDCRRLRDLAIVGKIKLINYQHCSSLESLALSKVYHLHMIDLHDFPHLRKFQLVDSQASANLCSESLEELRVISSCSHSGFMDYSINVGTLKNLTSLMVQRLNDSADVFNMEKCRELEKISICYRNKPPVDKYIRMVGQKYRLHSNYHPLSPTVNSISVDNITYTNPSKTHQVRQIFSSANQTIAAPHVSLYRESVYDCFMENNNLISITQTNDHVKLNRVKLPTSTNDEGVCIGRVQMTIHQGELVPLVGLSAYDQLLDVSDKHLFDVSFNELTGQYFICLKNNRGSHSAYRGVVEYKIVPSKDYFYSSLLDEIVYESDDQLLPDVLHQAISDIFEFTKNSSHHNNLNFEMLRHIYLEKDLTTKVDLIAAYCRGFRNAPLSKDCEQYPGNSIEVLIGSIVERKGACRHASIAFTALCQYFGVKARIIYNECHAFVEIPVDCVGWVALNLGGHQAELVIKQAPPLPKKNIKSSEEEKKPEHIQLASLSHAAKWEAFFSQLQSLSRHAETADAFIQSVTDHHRPVLVRVPLVGDAWRLRPMLQRYADDQKVPIFYVDSANELSLSTIKIKENGWAVIDSPLKQFLLGGCGSLIINWSTFSATERAIYKSIMDTPPTLHGMTFSANIRIIGILAATQEVNDVFLSRCDSVDMPTTLRLPQDFYPSRDWMAKKLSEEKVQVVDLYQSLDWFSMLCEEIIVQGNQMIVKKGPLIQAMEGGRSLIIQNPPWDDMSFRRWWHEFAVTEKMRHNGSVVMVKPGFVISLVMREDLLHMPKSVRLDNGPVPVERKGRIYYINCENYDSIYRTQRVTSSGNIYQENTGILSNYQENDSVVVTGITQSQWQQLLSHLAKLADQSHRKTNFHLFTSPAHHALTRTESVSSFDHQLDLLPVSGTVLIIEANDIDFVASRIAIKINVPSNAIFHLVGDHAWSNLIEQIELKQKQSTIQATRQALDFWKLLQQAGQTVIMAGPLSQQDYLLFQSLLSDTPHLVVNGERVIIKANLIWIYSPANKLNIASSPHYQIDISLADYYQALLREVQSADTKILDKLELYLKYTQNVFKQALTYTKFRAMYDALISKKNRSNLLKPFLNFHLKKESTAYAYVNVLAKAYWPMNEGPTVRRDKLMHLLDTLDEPSDFKRQFWRIANCFNGRALQRLFAHEGIYFHAKINKEGVHSPSDRMIEALSLLVNDAENIHEADVRMKLQAKTEHRFDKQRYRLMTAIQNSSIPMVMLIGGSGTGKTVAAQAVVRHLQKSNPHVQLFVGDDRIEQWLLAKQNDYAVLLLDEANLRKTGEYEFLRGMMSSVPLIHYCGKSYPLTPYHKVILTGNPLHFPGRYFHPVIFDCAHMIWFGQFQKSFMRDYITRLLGDKIKLTEKQITSVSHTLTEFYHDLRDNPQFVSELTLRDINTICTRFIYLAEKYQSVDFMPLLGQSVIDELGGLISDKKMSEDWMHRVRERCGVLPSATHTQPAVYHGVVVVTEKRPVWQLIEDDLVMREHRIKQGHNHDGKLGLLLEGPSGIGKSAFLLAALKQRGLSLSATNPRLKYYQVTVGSDHVEDILLKAFHGGSVVILDELNLDPALEVILNQLLSGVDPKGKPALHAGFMVLATQNPTKYLGCQAQSRAMVNRLHKIRMSDYAPSAFVEFARMKQHSDPEGVVGGYCRAKEKHPKLNARHFFSLFASGDPNLLSNTPHQAVRPESRSGQCRFSR